MVGGWRAAGLGEEVGVAAESGAEGWEAGAGGAAVKRAGSAETRACARSPVAREGSVWQGGAGGWLSLGSAATGGEAVRIEAWRRERRAHQRRPFGTRPRQGSAGGPLPQAAWRTRRRGCLRLSR
jgi:hypothetical protein